MEAKDVLCQIAVECGLKDEQERVKVINGWKNTLGYAGNKLNVLKKLVKNTEQWNDINLPNEVKALIEDLLYPAEGTAEKPEWSSKDLTPNLREQLSKLKLVEPALSAIRELQVSMHALVTPKSESCADLYEKIHKQTCPREKIWLPESDSICDVFGNSIFADCSTECPPNSGELETVQPYWTKIIETRIPRSNATLEVILVDAHKSPSIGTAKPDTVGYLKGHNRNLFYVSVIGENKGRRNTPGFSKKEKGQLLHYLQSFMTLQPHRLSITGFLSDGVFIQFFCYDNKGTLLETECLSLGEDGGRLLSGMLTRPPVQWESGSRFLQTVEGEPVELEDMLGRGASADVYSGLFQGSRVVVKHFLPNIPSGTIGTEISNLERLATLSELDDLVPKFRCETDNRTALLLSPVGLPFAPSAENFRQVLQIMRIIHTKLGMVHRDLRLCNLLLHPETKKVFINDWGSACKVDKGQDFGGAWRHTAKRVLLLKHNGHDTYQPQPEDDLEMVVYVVFELLWPKIVAELPTDPSTWGILRFWSTHLRGAYWQGLLTQASTKDYDGLAESLFEIFPSVPAPLDLRGDD